MIGESASKKLNILAHLKNLLDRKTLTTMYTALIRQAMQYGSIMFCNCTDAEEEMLEKNQRRAIRIITGGIVRTLTVSLYDEISLETLKTRRYRNVLLFFIKIMNNLVPEYLQELKPVQQKQDAIS